MSKESRVGQLPSVFSDDITPVVFDPHDAADAERGAKEIAQRL